MFLKSVALLCCLAAMCTAAPGGINWGNFGGPSRPSGGYSLNGNDNGFSAAFNKDVWRNNDVNNPASVNAAANFNRGFHDNINQVGAGLEYKSPSGGVSVNAQHTRGFDRDLGYDIGVQASKNLYTSNDGRTTVDANAGYNRHHGGPLGTGDPQYSGGINLEHKF